MLHQWCQVNYAYFVCVWSIVATDCEAWAIVRGSDGEKNRTKQRHTCDSMLFRTFVWIWTWCKDLSAVLFYMSHMFKFLLAKMWNCAEMWRAQSRIQWMMMFSYVLLVSFLIHWFTGSELVSNLFLCPGSYQWGVVLWDLWLWHVSTSLWHLF